LNSTQIKPGQQVLSLLFSSHAAFSCLHSPVGVGVGVGAGVLVGVGVGVIVGQLGQIGGLACIGLTLMMNNIRKMATVGKNNIYLRQIFDMFRVLKPL